jgi:hypothetical protein
MTDDKDRRPEVKKGAEVCPACGGRLVPILYGLPDAEAGAAAERGEIALGGCIVMGDDPHLACTKCHARYRSPGAG